jgi:hypothetical protein
MITVQYQTKHNGKHLFWVGRHGPHSIRIDANRPGVYRWMITREAQSVASGVAADRDQAAKDAAAALGELRASNSRGAHCGTDRQSFLGRQFKQPAKAHPAEGFTPAARSWS